MSSEAAIRKGKGIVSNPEFFLAFFLAAAMGIAGVLSVGVSGVWGWGLIAGVAVLAAIAHFTGLGQRFFVILLSLAGLVAGLVSAYVVFYLWAFEHEQALWGGLLALLLVVMPVAAIAGERILPLFVAFLAGVWGVMSVIVFVMAVFIGVE
ncbi:MAG TPA: hypothetical protein RMH99_18280 [Sandaracinaceae bacterium LLY-WYZ-13_1]|nr:hypothetical protein [Sandaracinaceae bacterium LLY-WYZ-13_1]